MRVAAHETSSLIDAHRERAGSGERVANGSCYLAAEGSQLIVQCRPRGAIEVRDGEMILEVLAHRLAVDERLDTERPQIVSIPDAGQLQQLRRVDRTAAQNHLLSRCDLDRPAIPDIPNAGGPLPFENHATGVCPDSQNEVAAAKGWPKLFPGAR